MSAVRTIRFEPSMPEADARKVIERLGGTVPTKDETHLIESRHTAPKSRSEARRLAAWKRDYQTATSEVTTDGVINESAPGFNLDGSPVTKVQS